MILRRQADKRVWLLVVIVSLMAIATGLLVTSPLRWLGLGLIALAGLLIVSVGNPAWIFTYVYPLLIWVGQIPIALGGTTVSLERLLILVGGMGVLVAILDQRVQVVSVPRWVAAGFGLWFGMYTLSLAVFPSAQGLTQVFGYAQKALMAYMVFIVLQTPAQIKTVLKLALLSSLFLSFFTIAVYFQEGSLASIRVSSFAASETLNDSLLQGLARSGAGNTMAVWIALLFIWQTKNNRQLFGGFLLVLWFGLLALFALRREVLVALPIGLALMLWHHPLGRRKRVFLIGLALFVVVLSFVVLSPEWMDRLSTETVDQLETGSDPRLTLLLRFTPAALANAPFLGHGPRNYAPTQFLFPDTVPSHMLVKGGGSPHNAWSAAAVEAGMVAFLGLTLFVYGLGRPLWQQRQTGDRDMDVIWAFAPLLFVQVLIKMFFGHAVTLPVTWFWFGYLLALERVTQQMSITENENHAPALHH